ncbi:purine-uracil permease NCS1-like isoform X2 [Phoenix dactylifera]|uniref:Purine-uracil permease NCS1-like isoform X2 n=1 Tax=Phoenix dactylifera TaxID=42345 RepID=A0A8B8J0Q4_PHODC|nr:purine-uracil permease NCS1-like isoform X2 [Phoenix dactylifera]
MLRSTDDGLELEPDASLLGSDLSPVPASKRTLTRWDIALLWVGMVVNVPSYYLAGSLVDLGMSWWQGVATIILGNTILLAPLILTAHPGTRYGIAFPVLLRSAFGVHGAHLPALLRALVACGWCGIETWIGGQAIFLLLPRSITNSWYAHPIRWLGTSALEFSCFILFLLAQLAILWKGMAGIRVLGNYSAPVLVLLTGWLFCWAYLRAGGFGEMLSTPSRLGPSQFWSVFFPSLTASISTWSGVALNIPDFTRFAAGQSDQIAGQLGLPIFMGLFTFTGLAITSSTQVIYGRVISNPIHLLAEIGGTFTIIAAIFGISLATITTNIPANFVAPANVLVSLSPSTFSFAGAALLTGIIGAAFQPWRIIESSDSFIYTWLVGYSAVLGPVSGIILTDYYVLRRMALDVNALCSADPRGPYYYSRGFNAAAIGALVVAVTPAVPGFLHKQSIGSFPAGDRLGRFVPIPPFWNLSSLQWLP